MCAYVCIWVNVHTYLHMCEMSICVHMFVYVHVCICVYILYVHMCVHVYIYIYVCVSGRHVRGYWGIEGPYREFITPLTVPNETRGLCMDFFDASVLAFSEFTAVVGRDPAVLGAHLIRHRRLTRRSSTSPPSTWYSSCPRMRRSSASRVAPVLLVAYVRFKHYVFGFFDVL